MEVIASFDAIAPVPWANGAGETTELVSLAESTELTPDRRRWRLSVARLERPGPFSSLPGLDRTFLPTAEVVLEIDGTAHRAGPGRLLRFSGDAVVALTGLNAPCCAVNLMVESATGDAPLPPVTMVSEPSSLPSLALTLETGGLAGTAQQWGRFDLLRFDAGDDTGTHVAGDGIGNGRLGVIGIT